MFKQLSGRLDYRRIISWIAVASMALPVLVVPVSAQAAELQSRTVTVGNSAASASTTYAITFTPAAALESVGSFKFEICDSPLQSVSCTAVVATHHSDGASFGSATFTSVTGTGIATSGWTKLSSTAGSTSGTQFILKNASAQSTSASPITVNLSAVVNPNTTNAPYYLRVTSYTGLDGATTPVDFGAVALSTATPIQVTAIVQEQLAFATGTSGTCAGLSGNTVDLGILTSSSPNSGTSLMCASTNATSGYNITVNGTTLTSGANSIAAMGTQTLNSSNAPASASNSPQFGMNLVANTTPAVGAAVDNTGGGAGAAVGGYNSTNGFRFFSGDTVAQSSVATSNSLYTVSYIANVNATQQAGIYSTTLTYICTGSF